MLKNFTGQYFFSHLQKSCVFICIKTEAFNRSIQLAHIREAIVGSALARHFNCAIRYNDSQDLKKWDYTLYNVDQNKSWLWNLEQGDDYYLSSKEGTLYFELSTHNQDGTKNDGKINYTRADKIVYVCNEIELILILEVKIIRQLISRYANEGCLETATPGDFEEWTKKHDTKPTTGALVPYADILTADPKASALNFYELNIPHHYKDLR